ncbi:hypothetical protein KC331_g9262 [Hortaea werneckii]|nr:hypothetical protein KC331_g9262 [Hortaea werneckii]KAI7712155.1 hypothetical protein KC353_g8467 [Hortaea werneckii]
MLLTLELFQQGRVANRLKRESPQKHMPTIISLHIQVLQFTQGPGADKDYPCNRASILDLEEINTRGVARAVITAVAIATETLRGKQPASQIPRSFKPSTNA